MFNTEIRCTIRKAALSRKYAGTPQMMSATASRGLMTSASMTYVTVKAAATAVWMQWLKALVRLVNSTVTALLKCPTPRFVKYW